MDIDDCYAKVVGRFGRYQIFVFCCACSYQLILPSINVLTVFVATDPAKLFPDNPRVKNDSSVLAEWGLLDKAWIGGLIQAVYFAGFLFGVVFLGQISDRYGRRPTMIVGFCLLFPICFFSSFSNSWQLFAAFRFATGFVMGGTTLVQFVYLQELIERSYWVLSGTIQSVFFPVGLLIFVFIAYFIPPWREMVRLLSCLQIIPLIAVFFMPESPRWLYSRGRLDDAERVLALIARRNGVHKPVISLKPLDLEHPTQSFTILDLCRNRITLKRLVVMAYIWFVNSFVYYALTLAAGEIGGNTYKSEALSGLVEIPGILILPLLLNRKRFGRTYTVLFSLLLSGFACLSLMGFDAESTSKLKLSLGLIGKFGITISFNSIYIYAPELFPTSVRNVAMGSLSMSARVGGILASFSESLLELHAMLGFFMFGACGISAGLITLLLPETLGKKPPNSFKDLEGPTLRSSYSGRDSSVSLSFPSLRKQSGDDEKAGLLSEDEEDMGSF